MSGLVHEDITRRILGAAFEVHGALGPGFLETVYEEALCHELQIRKIPFDRQVHIPIIYKRVPVGSHILDLIIDNKIVVELKAITELADIHRAIIWSYLTATKLPVGLLINFGTPTLQFKRIVWQKDST